MNIKELYETNPDVKEYVDKYAASNDCTVSEALEHRMIYEYIQYMKSKNLL